MLLNFEARFASLVAFGEKRHTIRAARKNAPRVGETCHCYTGLRRKGALPLGRWRCSRVESISIDPVMAGAPEARFVLTVRVAISGVELTTDEANDFFRRDGFLGQGIYPPIAQARDFWHDKLPFRGHLIHWEYADA